MNAELPSTLPPTFGRRGSNPVGALGNSVVPELIEPPSGRTNQVFAGQLRQWWLTVRVPPNTPAGRYRATVTARPEKAPPCTLSWRLWGWPF